ncbi:MAG: type VI secretion system tip protein VgrG [Glaciimonas sp.]|nr:type VI secretion system tip protein VgrG [Glaciimonas sp.]
MLSTALATLFNGWTQTDRLMRLHTVLDAEHGANTLMAESMQAVEGISPIDDADIDIDTVAAADGTGVNQAPESIPALCGYKLEITCLSLDAHLALKELIGQLILLELQTDASRTALRPFHGYITHCDMIGANGGLARYKLTIEPWLAFLRYRRDSAIYQDMTVLDIVESIFKDYQAQGTLQPQWKLELRDPSIYPKRSLTTQYQESDLHFVMRLLAEEGLFTYFQHQGDPHSPSFGSHTLIIADHNGSFTPNAQSHIAFSQPGAVMQRDSIDRWRSVRRWHTNAIAIASWDYRTANTRTVSATSAAHSATANSSDATTLLAQDAPGAYAFENRAQGERIANNQLQAIEARNKIFTGAGTVRTLAPGTTFTLSGHSDSNDDNSDNSNNSNNSSEDNNTFVVLRVVHLAHNNFSAALQGQIAQRLGAAALDNAPSAQSAQNTEAPQNPHALYRNRIDAIRAKIAYRPATRDAHGIILHPKPTVTGQQSAIVVGPAGHMIHTDRDHRIKVQFHWQRNAEGQNGSHSRLSHPHPEGHTGAPSNAQSGTWVRVMAGIVPIAGANWGGHAVPRIGQEVLIDFIEGDIDRPIVIGTLYNGQGQADAQVNHIGQGTGAASGNAPSWFPGEKGGHSHPAVLSGIKTQAMHASQSGNGAYNQLLFDDSPGQSRVALQHHASAHQGTAELNLGILRHQSDNQRLMQTGYGFELKSQHSTALRAGQGLLIATDARPNASSSQLDTTEAQAQLEQSQQLQQSLAATAQKHNAKLKDENAAEKIPAIDHMQHSIDVIKATASGGSSNTAEGNAGGTGSVAAYSEPQLQLSSPAGIAALTPADAILSAGSTSSITAGHDINVAAQGNSSHAVKAGISLFTYGKVSNQDKPNQETGIKLHAASGTVSMQSQSDETRITADKLITVASITKDVQIAAKDHVMLTAQGAYLKLEGGNIEIHGPGAMVFKASYTEFAGPQSANHSLPELPAVLPLADRYSTQFTIKSATGKPVAEYSYSMESNEGHRYQGVTDKEGKTVRFYTPTKVKFTVRKNLKKAGSKDVPTAQRTERFNEEFEG